EGMTSMRSHSQKATDQRKPPSLALLGVELAGEEIAPGHSARKGHAVTGHRGDVVGEGRLAHVRTIAVNEIVPAAPWQARKPATVVTVKLQLVPAHVRDLDLLTPAEGIPPWKAGDLPGKDPQAPSTRRLLAPLEEDLQAEADAKEGTVRREPRFERLA